MDTQLLHRALSLAPPPPVEGRRGSYVTISQSQLRLLFWQQGGTIRPICLSANYIVPTEAYMYEALRGFHDFLMAVTGKPPQHVYTTGVYVCVEFATGFKFYLDLCHLLHWEEKIGERKLAAGWATNVTGIAPIPDTHAFSVAVLLNKNKEPYLCALEPQRESKLAANYGELAAKQCTECCFC